MKRIIVLAALLLVITLVVGNLNFVFAANDISVLGENTIQKKYTMYLGTNDKDTLRQEIPTDIIRKEMHEICMKYVDGYTLTVSDGFYRDANNGISHETSLVYVFFDADVIALQKIMDEAIVKFNQGSILLEENDAKSIFYFNVPQ